MDLKWDPLCKHCGQRKGDHSGLAGYPCSITVPSALFLDSGQNRTDQGLVYDPKGLPAHPAVTPPWVMPAAAAPLGPWSSPTFSPQVRPAFQVGDRVVRLNYGAQGIPAGTHGTIVRKDNINQMFGVDWDRATKGTKFYGWADAYETFTFAGATTKAVANPAKCDTCSNPNAFNAAANQPNGAFRCGQCRALRQVFG